MKLPILILHGWMVHASRYHKIQEIFENNGYRVYIPDMPGFGKVDLVKDPMTVDDYVDWVAAYLKRNKIKRVMVIGHSFGGRVGAKLAVKYPELIDKLILTGTPLIKQPLSLKKRILSTIAKTGKQAMEKLPKGLENFSRKVLYRLLGEHDYYKAGSMKKTFVAVNNEDLSLLLPKISVPTLVLWGETDRFVPLKTGKAIAEKISHATLVTIANEGHRLPYENPRLFAEKVLAFVS